MTSQQSPAGGVVDRVEAPVGRAQQVLDYLRGRDWTSPTQIGRDVWGLGHHSASASPVCRRLVMRGALERNGCGHYRIPPSPR